MRDSVDQDGEAIEIKMARRLRRMVAKLEVIATAPIRKVLSGGAVIQK